VNAQDDPLPVEKPRRPRLRWLKRIGKGLLMVAVIIAGRMAWHHFQATKNLQEALAEMDRAEPGWRLEDIEAAREQVPEEENSARVVVAAATLLPKNWPPKEFDDLFAKLAPAEQLPPEDFARLKKELADVRPVLLEARKLAGMPRGRHHISYQRNVLDTLLRDQIEGRRISRLLVLDALRHDQEGNLKEALVSCRAALNTARAIGDEPFASSQLIRTAGVVAVCQAVEHTLGQGEPPQEEIIAISKLLAEEDAYADLIVSARGERAVDHGTFDALESGDVSFGQMAVGKTEWTDRFYALFYRDNLRDEHPIMLTLMTRWVAIAQLPSSEQAQVERQFEQEVRDQPQSAILTRLLLPHLTKLGEASRRKHACIRCISAALAAECYRQTHKRWPDSLDQLSPQFLPAVPLDPFDGSPLRYRRIEDGVVIYSLGNDGVDDSGHLDPERMTQTGVDVGYRLWDVSKRRQPPRPKPPPQPAPMPPRMQGNAPNPG
jgi:hypothetical protein